jgi:hypothetical protein
LSTGKAQVSVATLRRLEREREVRRRAEDARMQRLLEERRRAAAALAEVARARVEAEAQRTVEHVRLRERKVIAAARDVERVLGVDVPLTALPPVARASGQPVPADWLAAAERALAAMAGEVAAARRRGTQAALARVAEAERAAAGRAASGEVRSSRPEVAPGADAGAPVGVASEAPTAWRAEVVAAAERNVARLADAHDLSAHEHGSALLDQLVAAARDSDERTARARLARLRALVQQVSESRDRAAYDAARASDLRDHLVRLHGAADAAHPEWTGHLDRVVLGLEPLDVAVDRRISDHIIAESFALALESHGYTVGESFTVDLVSGGPAAAWRDGPEHDGHAVRFAMLPGSVVDFDLVSDASSEVDGAAFAELERRWCDEDLPMLAAALEDQGVTMTVDERSLPGEQPPQRVEGLRAWDRRRAATRRTAEEPRAWEVRG